jgi:hypothetical protein
MKLERRLSRLRDVVNRREGEIVLLHERPLVTDAQLRVASVDQIEDLVQRLNLVLQERR